MYTILMKTDKSLITVNKITLFQREKLVDKICFLIPQTYENTKISDCTVILKYLDSGNVAHMEELVCEKELYKDHLQYILNVDTKLSKFAGLIKMRLSFLQINTDNGIQEEVLHSDETVIEIKPMDDYFAFVSDESLETLDRKMAELKTQLKATEDLADSIDKNKADDISYENNTLQLMSNGKKIGSEKVLDQQKEMDVIDFDNKQDQTPSEDDDDHTLVEF